MKTYAIINTALMSATVDGAIHKSFKISTADGLQNGSVVVSNETLEAGENQIFGYTTPAVTTPLEDIYILATPEINPKSRLLSEFTNAKDSIALGVKLKAGNVFGLTAEGFSGTPSVGSIVELAAATKLKAVATLTSGSTKVGKIVRKDTNGMFYVSVGE